VNFVGHVAVARWHGADPAFVLGTMLPDFLGMARARVRTIDDPAVARGVALHHETDDVFHHAPPFLELCAMAGEALEAAGVRRGTARAVAHIGAELFLDGILLEGDDELRRLYVDGLAAGRSDRAGGRIAFRSDEAATRFATLQRRLEGFGVPDGYRDPAFVGDRLVGALASRPRLAIDAASEGPVRGYLPELQRAVVARAEPLVRILGDALHPDRRRGDDGEGTRG